MLMPDLSVTTDPVSRSTTPGGWRTRTSRLLLVGVGLLLLAAAALKLGAGEAGTLGQNSVLFSPPVQMLSVVAEIALGVGLVGGWWRPGAWAAASLFFALMAGVSLWLAVQGQSSCGCFGRVAVHPWATFGLDVGILVALAVFHPKPLAWPQVSARARPAVLAVAGALALVALGSLGLMSYWGVGPEGLVARLRGQPMAIGPFLTDLGSGRVGDVVVFRIAVTNHSGRDVRLVGGSESCSCAVLDELPLDIPAGEQRDVSVRAAFKGTPGRFQHEVMLYTDHQDQVQLVARFGGTVAAD